MDPIDTELPKHRVKVKFRDGFDAISFNFRLMTHHDREIGQSLSKSAKKYLPPKFWVKSNRKSLKSFELYFSLKMKIINLKTLRYPTNNVILQIICSSAQDRSNQ